MDDVKDGGYVECPNCGGIYFESVSDYLVTYTCVSCRSGLVLESERAHGYLLTLRLRAVPKEGG